MTQILSGKNFALILGIMIFIIMIFMPPLGGMTLPAWRAAALVILMAIWWMTQALPLTITALLPFLVLPLMDIMPAKDVAAEYYSPILFLILGGAFIALAIERVGLHSRVAISMLKYSGKSNFGMLITFMAATAFLSMIISNTSTTLIMIPIAIAVLRAGGFKSGDTFGMAGALMMGIAFSASIGGLGTLVGSPTNAIAAGLINKQLGMDINFLRWASFGMPIVIISVPICALILSHVQKLSADIFNVTAAKKAIGHVPIWSIAEKRLIPIISLVIIAWILQPFAEPYLPKGAITDGSIAIAGALFLFIVQDGTGRPLLIWKEAERAPWGVIMMFGGGLALAAGITASGLSDWLGQVLQPLQHIHPLIVAALVVAMVILITEFASNVATASGIMPVIASLALATGIDPIILAMPAAMAASWGFMLPSGTGPNALAWASDHIELPKMLRAGAYLDIAGIPIIVGVVWAVNAMM
ncbi:C4-dicarboxylate ABC transporter [Sphingorhabdus lutea]|uniref:C4-dicarboxylate ABC transporter n=1 Tax=Sphingorhabdus lutea TaxID=1913578 RepID=A0A1L3JB33_9SPHN|nr:DASS family sodium-coupled anion symporter [Sphingorhabdus lutea]APG62319.1 C4-dicarboxylate ABC transporter [Sphingorhabdus lutea]